MTLTKYYAIALLISRAVVVAIQNHEHVFGGSCRNMRLSSPSSNNNNNSFGNKHKQVAFLSNTRPTHHHHNNNHNINNNTPLLCLQQPKSFRNYGLDGTITTTTSVWNPFSIRHNHHHHHYKRKSQLFESNTAGDDDDEEQEQQQPEPVFFPGQVLLPSRKGDKVQFDTACVAHPVVLPPTATNPLYQMYYYGNAGSWNHNIPSFLPTGSIGLAESPDGIHWTKVPGKHNPDGSVLGPSPREEDWDSVHVGLGDVVRVGGDDGTLEMYYFGAGTEGVEVGGGGVTTKGLRMRIGRARSVDGGRSWERLGMVLDYDDEEGLFASWPKLIIPPSPSTPWRLIYHTFNGSTWSVYSATSTTSGQTWTRSGLLLSGDTTDPSSFDYHGIGTRSITPYHHNNGLLMVYEGVGKDGVHRLGAAFCADDGGGGPWEKLVEPIAQPGGGVLGEWTRMVIGTPCVVMEEGGDGKVCLYFCGKRDSEMSMSIGLVVSESGSIGPDSWSLPASTTASSSSSSGTTAAAASSSSSETVQQSPMSMKDVVQKVAGLKESEWKRITSRFPEIETYNASNCRDCLSKLQQRLSITSLDLKKKIILRLPQVLGYCFDVDVGPELELLKKGLELSDGELTSLVLKCPQIVGVGYEEVVRPRIEALCGGEGEEEGGLDLAGVKDLILQKPAELAIPVRGAASSKK